MLHGTMSPDPATATAAVERLMTLSAAKSWLAPADYKRQARVSPECENPAYAVESCQNTAAAMI